LGVFEIAKETRPEPNLLVVAQEVERGFFQISFSQAADWQNATLFRKSQNRQQLTNPQLGRKRKSFGTTLALALVLRQKDWAQLAASIYLIFQIDTH
jgi:hypothetical protein